MKKERERDNKQMNPFWVFKPPATSPPKLPALFASGEKEVRERRGGNSSGFIFYGAKKHSMFRLIRKKIASLSFTYVHREDLKCSMNMLFCVWLFSVRTHARTYTYVESPAFVWTLGGLKGARMCVWHGRCERERSSRGRSGRRNIRRGRRRRSSRSKKPLS